MLLVSIPPIVLPKLVLMYSAVALVGMSFKSREANAIIPIGLFPDVDLF